MTTEISASPALKADAAEHKINYLWLNGERVIGIEGLEIFEDCRQLHHLPAIKDEQRDTLNHIINTALEKYAEEGICNYWPSLVARAKEFFSEQGYCVIGQDKVKIDLRQREEMAPHVFLQNEAAEKSSKRILTVADLWSIHHMRKVRLYRRYL